MKFWLQPIQRILRQTLLLLLCYWLSRTVFTIINLNKFQGLSLNEFLKLCLQALRFDISTIAAVNALYFSVQMLPFPFQKWKWLEKGLQGWFVVSNMIAFLFEISDWAYFPFTQKRTTIDVFDMVSRKGDFLNLLPHFLVDYWFVPLGIIGFAFLFNKASQKIGRDTPYLQPIELKTSSMLIIYPFRFVFITGLSLLAIRGGLQYIPIGNGNALQVADVQFVPIVLNTPFSIMHSYSGKMEEVHFYEEKELKHYFNPIKQYAHSAFKAKNVVVIILESFSKQYTGIGGRKSYTPFLDSLMQLSLVCMNAYANSLTSADGIPCVLSGMPSLMEEPITTSSYGTDKLTSIPSLLKEKGYETAFFHGGTNGTMSFDLYAAAAGFQHYYGRKEYNNEADYDGNWGIWDEPFLQYFSKECSKMKQPFMASVFTLSSHDPFKVPTQYKNTLPKGAIPVEQCIAYTDLALKKFFESAAKEPWFQNTLFVLTPDHCSPESKDEYYSSLKMGMYAIPIVFFAPEDTSLKGRNYELVQQLDVLPTVMDYLGYEQPFFAFGNSIFQPAQPRYLVNELSGKYQWFMNDYLMTANETNPDAFYDFKRDSLCQNNLIQTEKGKMQQEHLPYFKAFLQLYRFAVIHNRLTAEGANGK